MANIFLYLLSQGWTAGTVVLATLYAVSMLMHEAWLRSYNLLDLHTDQFQREQRRDRNRKDWHKDEKDGQNQFVLQDVEITLLVVGMVIYSFRLLI